MYAVLDGGVDIAVGIVAQVIPDGRATRVLKGYLAFGFGGVEQEGDHRVLRNVSGDVLLRVVGAHLLLVDVLLEDVAENVRIDLVVVAQRALVEMPLIGVEEVEDALEGVVGNLDVRAAFFNRVLFEQAAVQIGNVSKQLVEFRVARLAAKPLMEEAQQEVAVERIEFVLALFLLTSGEPVAQIVALAVEKALPLHEVDEHQPVEHQRGVPFLVRHIGDAA